MPWWPLTRVAGHSVYPLVFLCQYLNKMADVAAPADKKAPPKFKQRTTRTFKSKAPKPGQKG